MTITVDINVLLDVFRQRHPHYAASAQVVSLVASGELIGIYPAHGLTTLYYLVRKHAAKGDAEAAMDRVLLHFQIGNLDAADWRRARQLRMDDFEDAALACVAESSNSSFIVTRNVKDFDGSAVSVITPTDFLTQYAGNY